MRIDFPNGCEDCVYFNHSTSRCSKKNVSVYNEMLIYCSEFEEL